jgi:hypothetical protein
MELPQLRFCDTCTLSLGEALHYLHLNRSLLFTPASLVPLEDRSASALKQTTQRPHIFDGSGHMSSVYLEMAVEKDKKMTEAWKADADSILIFVSISLQCHSPTDLMAHRLVYSLRP